MFIFYYAVLSEVSPPTALSPFAAAAITGGNPFKTMMLTWKYTLPAFIVPFMFTLSAAGTGLLLRGSPGGVALAILTATAGIAAFAAAFGGWAWGPLGLATRSLAGAAGVSFLLGTAEGAAAGTAMAGLVLILQFMAASRRNHFGPRR